MLDAPAPVRLVPHLERGAVAVLRVVEVRVALGLAAGPGEDDLERRHAREHEERLARVREVGDADARGAVHDARHDEAAGRGLLGVDELAERVADRQPARLGDVGVDRDAVAAGLRELAANEAVADARQEGLLLGRVERHEHRPGLADDHRHAHPERLRRDAPLEAGVLVEEGGEALVEPAAAHRRHRRVDRERAQLDLLHLREARERRHDREDERRHERLHDDRGQHAPRVAQQEARRAQRVGRRTAQGEGVPRPAARRDERPALIGARSRGARAPSARRP